MKSFLKIGLAFGLPITLNACGGESATKYSFDLEEIKQNTKQYVLSDGQMDELGCTFASLLFTKEMLESVKEDKEPNKDNAENFPQLRSMSIRTKSNGLIWVKSQQ